MASYSQGFGGTFNIILSASQGFGGSYQAGEIDAPAPSTFVPSGLEALSHEIINTVGIDPTLMGEPITLHYRGGSSKTVYAVVDYGIQTVQQGFDGRRLERRSTAYVSYDATLGFTDHTALDSITLRGEVFSIENIGERQGGCWTIDCVRSERQERTAGNMKRRTV